MFLFSPLFILFFFFLLSHSIYLYFFESVISNKYMFTTLSYATTFLVIDDADHPEVIL